MYYKQKNEKYPTSFLYDFYLLSWGGLCQGIFSEYVQAVSKPSLSLS